MSLMTAKEANTKLREAVRDSLNFVKKSVELEKHLLTLVEAPKEPEAKGKGKNDEQPVKFVAPLQHLTPEEALAFAAAFKHMKVAVLSPGFAKRTTSGTITNMVKDLDEMIGDLTGLANGTLRPLNGEDRAAAEAEAAEKAEQLQALMAEMAALEASLKL